MAVATTIIITLITTTIMTLETHTLLRLQSWLSPAFPTGGYAYSQGLEQAVEAGRVTDLETLIDWIDAVLRFGSGRLDASFLAAAWETWDDEAALRDLAALSAAMRGSAELGLETTAQGAAFLTTVQAAWPDTRLARLIADLAAAEIPTTLPIAVGVAAGVHGLDVVATVPAYLQAFAANQVHAAQRLMAIGQTDGQRALARLEPVIHDTAAIARARRPEDLGSAPLMVDLSSLRHETQYTRLFRS